MTDPLTRYGLERFAETAAGHVGEDKAPGLVALVASGEQVHVEAVGSLTIGGPPVTRDSLFRIASTSKPVTGATAMSLVDDGVITLDSPVGSWLPELAAPRVLARMDGPLGDTVAAARPITVRDLMTFTFGFGITVEMFASPEPWPVVAAANDLHLSTLGAPDPGEQPDQDGWIAGLGSLPLIAQPGERWLYNTGATVLGILISRAAGMPLPELMQSRIFEPLKMSDTAFWTSDTSRLAGAYRNTPAGLEMWDPPAGQWSGPRALADGAAGLVSTADDLLAFARMLMGRGEPVLSAAAISAMTSDQLSTAQKAQQGNAILNGRSWGFCQSVITDGPRAGAFGWDGGFGTTWLVDPLRDLVVIVLTQRMFDSPDAPTVHQELQSAAYAALAQPPRQ